MINSQQHYQIFIVSARKMQIYPLTIDKTEEKSDCVKFTSIGY